MGSNDFDGGRIKGDVMSTKDILLIDKTNEIHNYLEDTWNHVFRWSMDSEQSGSIAPAMSELILAIERAQNEILNSARRIKN